jgi:uncharacterized membrane protein YczE
LEYIIKIIIVAVGSVLMSLGITFYLNAGLGADPLTVFTSGVSSTLGLSVGSASICIMGTVMLFIFFIERRRLGLGTIMNALIIGWFIDIFMKLEFLHPSSIAISILMIAMAAIMLGVGMGIYISGGLGEGAVDAIMILLSDRMKANLRWVKIVMDIFLLVAGGLLGGRMGVGTVVGVLATGPIVEMTIGIIKKKEHLLLR